MATHDQGSPSATMQDSGYSWFRLAISLAIATVGNVGMWMPIMVLPDMQAEFEMSRGMASMPYALTMIGFGIGNVVIGRWVDRYGVTRCLVVSGLFVSVGFVLTAYSGSALVASILHGLMGFGAAACFGPLLADVSRWFARRRGLAVSIVASGNYFAGAIWPWMLTSVLASDGWRGVYLVLAALVLLTVVPLALLLRREVPEEATISDTAAASIRAATISLSPTQLQLVLMVAGVACCIAMSMPQVHIVALCIDLGYGPAVGAEMLALMLLGGVVSRLVSGVLADWLGGVRTVLIGSVLQCIGLALFLPWDSLSSLYIVSLLFGLSQGGIVPSYAVIVREYLSPREAGARVGIVITASIVGMAIGGWMTGWIFDLTGSYEMAFLNGIAWNIVNILIILGLLISSRPRAAAPA